MQDLEMCAVCVLEILQELLVLEPVLSWFNFNSSDWNQT
jgi:hypothetical protein